MAKIVFGGAMSHSPMMNYPIPRDHDQVAVFKRAVAEMGRRIREVKPDVVVIFGPDHFRALFYDLMPAFVIGVGRVAGWGDWHTPIGPFATCPTLAKHVLKTTLTEGFDPASSYDIKVDHGVIQPVQLMDLADLPIVPVVFNAAGPPLPTPIRCHAFGAAVGRAIESFSDDIRVAIVASGGISHDPPVPSPESNDPEIVERAIHGRINGFAASKERETSLLENVTTLQGRINPEWDRYVLDRILQGAAAKLARELTTESIFTDGGNGAQEIRTWIAMAGALGDRKLHELCYEPINALVTGMGVIVS
jgi:2,3-dihydroxyphenylpropionate 1,2-dioxygenase